jgi:hypothetical protein
MDENISIENILPPTITKYNTIISIFTKGFINDNNNCDSILKYIEKEALLNNPNPYNLLVISSCFLLASGMIAFINGLWIYFALSFITTAISINHWRDVRAGPRRTADLIGAKISFVIFFISGCFAIPTIILQWVAVPICGLMIILYYFSNKLREQGIRYWIYIHFIFHMLVAFEQVLVILWIVENQKNA